MSLHNACNHSCRLACPSLPSDVVHFNATSFRPRSLRKPVSLRPRCIRTDAKPVTCAAFAPPPGAWRLVLAATYPPPASCCARWLSSCVRSPLPAPACAQRCAELTSPLRTVLSEHAAPGGPVALHARLPADSRGAGRGERLRRHRRRGGWPSRRCRVLVQAALPQSGAAAAGRPALGRGLRSSAQRRGVPQPDVEQPGVAGRRWRSVPSGSLRRRPAHHHPTAPEGSAHRCAPPARARVACSPPGSVPSTRAPRHTQVACPPSWTSAPALAHPRCARTTCWPSCAAAARGWRFWGTTPGCSCSQTLGPSRTSTRSPPSTSRTSTPSTPALKSSSSHCWLDQVRSTRSTLSRHALSAPEHKGMPRRVGCPHRALPGRGPCGTHLRDGQR